MDSAIKESIARFEAQVNGRGLGFSEEVVQAAEDACKYARLNDLTFDSNNIDPLLCLNYMATTQTPATNDLTDDAHLPTFQCPNPSPPVERPTVTPGALAVLTDAIPSYTSEELRALEDDVCGFGLLKPTLELPLLRSDHARDWHVLQEEVHRIRSNADIANHRLPLDPADIENDEGLTFASSANQEVEALDKMAETETIDITKEALTCLAMQLKVQTLSQEDQNSLLWEYITYQKNPAREHLTPPLSPIFKVAEPFVPNGDVCLVPIPSDPSSRLSEDLAAAEDALFQMEEGFGSPSTSLEEVASLSDLFPEELLRLDTTPTRESGLSRISSLKVDVPLIPPEKLVGEPLTVDLKGWSESIASNKTPNPLDDQRKKDMESNADRQLMEEMEQRSDQTMRKIEQETLQATDALARVPVPVMDFSVPEVPWKHVHNDPLRILDWMRQSYPDAFVIPEWSRDKLAEGRMRWLPLRADAGKVSIDEKIECPTELIESYISIPSHNSLPASIERTAGSPEFTFLRKTEDEDDDEIEPIFHKEVEAFDLMDIVKKKRRLLGLPDDSEDILQRPSHATGITTFADHDQQRNSFSGDLLISDPHSSMSKLVGNFMELQGRKQPLTHSAFFATSNESKLCETAQNSNSSNRLQSNLEEVHAMPVPCPAVDGSTTPPRVILALSLPRRISRQLRESLPNLAFIERDYDAHNSSIWLPGSVCRSEVISPLADEADIILSPASAIIITTMVRVRQKTVPSSSGAAGRPATTPFRNRIEKISAKYEKLILLVSEGSKDGTETMGVMAPSDSLAFAELQGFLSSLETAITAYYIGGGEGTVAKWAASFIVRSDKAKEVEHFLLDSETYWELFLRRAGMNVYGAQVVCGILKGRQNVQGDAGPGGLSAFVKMTAVERIAQFEGVFGGRRVLERVTQVLDAPWH